MTQNLNKKIGSLIRKLRLEKNLSQMKLAELSKHSTNHVGAIERGEKNISVQTLYSITHVLDISLESFFSLIDPAEKDTKELIEIYFSLSDEQKVLILNLLKSTKKLNK
ncbi:helix-turn-helix domain-containing protein [Enterococcus mediterraneensis]|uniref:helix-turn-helix domain-containing protein n=1 Tax=Enterococcus mediterraneensis TaxID=2364791 RepID=UPI0019D157D0|nr:helix-turn-helix transcriptional regulator [Enterococcus mediterraneensis]